MANPIEVESNPLFNKTFEEQCNVIINWQDEKIAPKALFSLDNNFNKADLKKSFNHLSMHFHPDKNADNKDVATQAIAIINEANDYLKNQLDPSANKLSNNIFTQNQIIANINPGSIFKNLNINFFKPYQTKAELGVELKTLLYITISSSISTLIYSIAALGYALKAVLLDAPQAKLKAIKNSSISSLKMVGMSILSSVVALVLTVVKAVSILSNCLATAAKTFISHENKCDDNQFDDNEKQELLFIKN